MSELEFRDMSRLKTLVAQVARERGHCAQREERSSRKQKRKRTVCSESFGMSQSKGRQVVQMVPGVLPPGAQGAVNQSHRKGLGESSKLLN